MYSIQKKISFQAGHRLMNNLGKCRFIHGHEYCVVLELSGEELKKDGTLVDFNDISSYVKDYIDKYLDHGLILNQDDTFWIDAVQSKEYKLYILNNDPSAENLAKHFYHLFKERFPELIKITVQETPTSEASYKES